jgi:hypothetical protein
LEVVKWLVEQGKADVHQNHQRWCISFGHCFLSRASGSGQVAKKLMLMKDF